MWPFFVLPACPALSTPSTFSLGYYLSLLPSQSALLRSELTHPTLLTPRIPLISVSVMRCSVLLLTQLPSCQYVMANLTSLFTPSPRSAEFLPFILLLLLQPRQLFVSTQPFISPLISHLITESSASCPPSGRVCPSRYLFICM